MLSIWSKTTTLYYWHAKATIIKDNQVDDSAITASATTLANEFARLFDYSNNPANHNPANNNLSSPQSLQQQSKYLKGSFVQSNDSQYSHDSQYSAGNLSIEIQDDWLK